MQNDWLYIGVFLPPGAPVFPALALIIPRIIAPVRPTSSKTRHTRWY
jgi:hypothetical protein